MTRTRIKICGISDVEQARAVSDAGADALGLVFYPQSPRHVNLERAVEICRAVSPLLTIVGLFVDPKQSAVEEVLARCPIHLLQFHGNENARFCEGFARPYVKALRMRPELDVDAAIADYRSASAFLFDAYTPGVPGGTGSTFDWARLPSLYVPWLLAGGLTAENVGQAMRASAPPAVDVSGGVEVAPGRKDPRLISQFVQAVRAADAG